MGLQRLTEPGFIVPGIDGRSFFVRTVFPGGRYGLDDCLTHGEADPLIEFYDRSHVEKFGPRGQFVSRYFASTLAKHDGGGLDLMGYVAPWKIPAASMVTVRDWALTIAPEVTP